MNKLFYIKFLYIIPVVFALISGVFFLLAGMVKSFHGYHAFIEMGFVSTEMVRPGIDLLEGLDSFLISLVFTMFGLGLARLYVFDKVKDDAIPTWLNVKSLHDLKTLLWETILFTLAIFCVTHIVRENNFTLNSLIFPAVILVLALAFFVIHQVKHK